jgi:hypothetical protein
MKTYAVSFMLKLLYSQRKIVCLLDRRQGGPWCQSEPRDEETPSARGKLIPSACASTDTEPICTWSLPQRYQTCTFIGYNDFREIMSKNSFQEHIGLIREVYKLHI